METDSKRMQDFKENEIIIRQGEVKNEMYKIISGKVAVYINYGQENEYLLGILSEQQCFGELEILCKKPSIYTVVAVYDVLLMRIREDEFDDFIKNNSNNASDMIRNLARQVMNLKLNMDMMMDEFLNSSEEEKKRAQELQRKIYQNAVFGENWGLRFNMKI